MFIVRICDNLKMVFYLFPYLFTLNNFKSDIHDIKYRSTNVKTAENQKDENG